MCRGDRFHFVKSAGRPLESKEEAVVLGAFQGRLWYRLDTQQSDSRAELVESAELAWCLSSPDVEDICFERSLLPSSTTSSPSPSPSPAPSLTDSSSGPSSPQYQRTLDPHSVLNLPEVRVCVY